MERLESLQKKLARELDTDRAATPCSQMTRLPGFMNQKYAPPCLVTIDYRRTTRVLTPADFPVPAKPDLLRMSSRRACVRRADAYVRARLNVSSASSRWRTGYGRVD